MNCLGSRNDCCEVGQRPLGVLEEKSGPALYGMFCLGYVLATRCRTYVHVHCSSTDDSRYMQVTCCSERGRAAAAIVAGRCLEVLLTWKYMMSGRMFDLNVHAVVRFGDAIVDCRNRCSAEETSGSESNSRPVELATAARCCSISAGAI